MSKEITTAQTHEALVRCIGERWQVLVDSYASQPVGGRAEQPGIPLCSLCGLFAEGDDCGDCPLNSCGECCNEEGSLYQDWKAADTTTEHHTASVNMTAKLRELRDEWAAKLEAERREAEKPVFKVGDRVKCVDSGGDSRSHAGDIGTVVEVKPNHCGEGIDLIRATWDAPGNTYGLATSRLELLEPLPAPVIEVGDIIVWTYLPEKPVRLYVVNKIETNWRVKGYDGRGTGGCLGTPEEIAAKDYAVHAKPAEVLEALKYYRARHTK